jgi:hypothetical protein
MDQPQSLFDVSRAFSRRMSLGRILEVEHDVRPYLAAVIVAAMQRANDTLVIPKDLKKDEVEPE